jgi:hypothetical protein
MFKFILVVFAMMILAVLSNAGHTVIYPFKDKFTGHQYQIGDTVPPHFTASRIQDLINRQLISADTTAPADPDMALGLRGP